MRLQKTLINGENSQADAVCMRRGRRGFNYFAWQSRLRCVVDAGVFTAFTSIYNTVRSRFCVKPQCGHPLFAASKSCRLNRIQANRRSHDKAVGEPFRAWKSLQNLQRNSQTERARARLDPETQNLNSPSPSPLQPKP